MSELLFPRVRARKALERRLAALAAVATLVFGAFSLWLGASFVGLVGGDVVATARVVTLGDSLGVNSTVRFRGLRVGRVVSVDDTRDADGLYSAQIVVDEEHVDHIPATVRARVLPGTLFGAEYVDLRLPPATPEAGAAQVGPGEQAAPATRVGAKPPGGEALADGAVVQADTSEESVRLMDTFSALHRVISAVDPAAVDLALSELAGALDGRGEDMRAAITRVTRLVDQYAAVEPTFYKDLAYLSANLQTLAQVEPDLVAALQGSLPLARTISQKAQTLDRLERSAAALAAEVSGFLEAQGGTFARFLDEVAPTYAAFVDGRGAFERILRLAPGVLMNGANAVKDGMVTMAAIFSTQQADPYDAGDCPRYGSLEGANCR